MLKRRNIDPSVLEDTMDENLKTSLLLISSVSVWKICAVVGFNNLVLNTFRRPVATMFKKSCMQYSLPGKSSTVFVCVWVESYYEGHRHKFMPTYI